MIQGGCPWKPEFECLFAFLLAWSCLACFAPISKRHTWGTIVRFVSITGLSRLICDGSADEHQQPAAPPKKAWCSNWRQTGDWLKLWTEHLRGHILFSFPTTLESGTQTDVTTCLALWLTQTSHCLTNVFTWNPSVALLLETLNCRLGTCAWWSSVLRWFPKFCWLEVLWSCSRSQKQTQLSHITACMDKKIPACWDVSGALREGGQNRFGIVENIEVPFLDDCTRNASWIHSVPFVSTTCADWCFFFLIPAPEEPVFPDECCQIHVDCQFLQVDPFWQFCASEQLHPVSCSVLVWGFQVTVAILNTPLVSTFLTNASMLWCVVFFFLDLCIFVLICPSLLKWPLFFPLVDMSKLSVTEATLAKISSPNQARFLHNSARVVDERQLIWKGRQPCSQMFCTFEKLGFLFVLRGWNFLWNWSFLDSGPGVW